MERLPFGVKSVRLYTVSEEFIETEEGMSPRRRGMRQHHAAVQFGECFIRLRREEYCA